MSITVPPAADLDRPSDFGELWPHAEEVPRPASVMPEPEVQSLLLSPEQHARRVRLRRAVGGVVLGLLAFTALAGCVYVVRSRTAALSSTADAKLVNATPSAAEHTQAPLPAAIAQLSDPPPLSEADQALALAHAPVATAANLQAWSQLASQLSTVDRRRVEHDLSRLTVTGARPVQETARLELALLWRATARRAKAQKVLVSLARTASDPLVKKYALDTLTAV